MDALEKRVDRLEEGQMELSNRTTRNEEKISSIALRLSGQEANCLRIHDALDRRLEKYINNEVHELQQEIERVRLQKREALSRSDWAKIVVTFISTSGLVAIALIELYARYRFGVG